MDEDALFRRPLTPARPRALVLLGGLALALAACQAPAAPPPRAAAPTLASQAAEALDKGEYARAADLYHRALAGDADNLGLHYGLGVAASYLNLKDEAIREFKWVLERGAKGSPEAEAARRWLASAGALASVEPAASPAPDSGPAAGQSSLQGRMVLPEAGPARRRMVILYGVAKTPTEQERYQTRTDENGRFEFSRLVPGPYMITDAVAGAKSWRLRVEVQPGQAATLDLTPANSIKIRDDFPNQG